jgi:hypothetical protein
MRFGWQRRPKRVPMGPLWEHICETRGIVKMMLPFGPEHYFEGPRACGMVSDVRLW